MKLLLDQNIPIALAAWLESKAVDVTHLKTTAYLRATDREIASWARLRFDAVVTRDKDFQNHIPIALHDPLQLVHLRIGNAKVDVFLAWFAMRWDRIELALKQGEQVIEVV